MDLAELMRVRSMLVILLATCQQTLLALQAVGNAIDTDLAHDLAAMIGRSEKELVALEAKIATAASA